MFVSGKRKKLFQKKIPPAIGQTVICDITISILWEFVFLLPFAKTSVKWPVNIEIGNFIFLFSPSGAS